MAKRYKGKKKGPFDDLSTEFKDTVAALDKEGLKTRLAEVSKSEEANQAAKKADEDLNRLKDQVKVAGEGYRMVTKENKAKMGYVIANLADKGDEVALQIVRHKLAAADQKSGF